MIIKEVQESRVVLNNILYILTSALRHSKLYF